MSEEPLDIVAVLGYYGFDLPSPEGGWRTVKCLFHEDSNASGRYSPDAGAYACQACPAKGNAITLIAWKEGITNGEAMELYSKISGGSIVSRRRAEDVAPIRRRPFERNSGIPSARRKPFQ